MSITVTHQKDCMDGTRNCIPVSFDIDSVTEADGILALLTIPYSLHASIQNGSIMTVNGVIFTFDDSIGANDDELNLIQLLASDNDTFVNINAAITGNYDLNPTLQSSTSTLNQEIQVSGLSCDVSIEVTFTNLLIPDVTISASPTPIQYKEGYKVLCKLTATRVDISREFELHPTIVLSDDKCSVASITAEKDVAKMLQPFVSNPIPDTTLPVTLTGTVLNELLEPTLVQFTEFYNNTTHVLNTSRDTIQAYAGGYPKYETTDRLLPYCNTVNPLPIRFYDNCNSPFAIDFIYFHLDELPNDTEVRDFSIQVQFTDTNGNTTTQTTHTVYSGQDEQTILCIPIGLPQLESAGIIPGGLDKCDIASYTVTGLDALRNLATVKTYNTATLEICRKPCNEVFLFTNTLGTYQSITTNCINTEILRISQDFINQCEPCLPNTTDRGITNINTKAYKEFEIAIPTSDHDSEFLEQFLHSDSVLWCYEDNFYWVQPLTTSYTTNEIAKKTNITYRFRIYTKTTI